MGWAQLRGAARASVDLLYATAVATALIPATSLASIAFGAGGPWSHADETLLVGVVAGLGAAGFVGLALITRRRVVTGPRDSVWAAGSRLEPGT